MRKIFLSPVYWTTFWIIPLNWRTKHSDQRIRILLIEGSQETIITKKRELWAVLHKRISVNAIIRIKILFLNSRKCALKNEKMNKIDHIAKDYSHKSFLCWRDKIQKDNHKEWVPTGNRENQMDEVERKWDLQPLILYVWHSNHIIFYVIKIKF